MLVNCKMVSLNFKLADKKIGALCSDFFIATYD